MAKKHSPDTLQELESLSVRLGNPSLNLILHTLPPKLPEGIPGEEATEAFRWRMEITPRIATLSGFELGTNTYINPATPEGSAAELRESLKGSAGPETVIDR